MSGEDLHATEPWNAGIGIHVCVAKRTSDLSTGIKKGQGWPKFQLESTSTLGTHVISFMFNTTPP
jgi:hypothetical protein